MSDHPPADQILIDQAQTTSAWGSGKLIVLGEHAVVYDHPALAIALPQGLKVTIRPVIGDYALPITLVQQGLAPLPMAESKLLTKALTLGFHWAQKQGLPLESHYECAVSGALPFKVGLGSSAALSVAFLRALATAADHQWPDHLLFDGAMIMEKVFHHQPSGLDHQVSIQGGALRFQRQENQVHFTPITLAQPLHLVLTWGPRQGTTADAVAGVAQRYQANPESYQQIGQAIERVTEQGLLAVQQGDLSSLGDALNHNHHYLEQLGVVTPALNQARDRFLEAGALGAKMSGAGHGGTCFGLFSRREFAQNLSQQLEQQHLPTWQVTLT